MLTSKTKYVAFRCPNKLLKVVEMRAKKERRNLSNYIVCALERDVKHPLPESHPLFVENVEGREFTVEDIKKGK